MMMKRSIAGVSCLILLAPIAMAQQRPEVRAAEESARQQLRGQVMALTVAPGLTVRSIADRQASAVGVDEIVAGAQQVGGPRWVDSDIVQVKMQVPATAVLKKLTDAPADVRDPRVTPGVLQRLAREWAGRQVQASGQAVPAEKIAAAVAASPSDDWADVPGDRRIDAARRAQASAAQGIVAAGGAIRVGPNETLGQSWDAGAAKAVADWAMTLPATRVLLRDDRQVEIGLFVDKPGYSSQLLGTLPADRREAVAVGKAIAAGVTAMPTVFVGRASVVAAAPSVRPVLAGRASPAWAGRLLTADATAPGGPDRLRTARTAETAAARSLRAVIDALPLDESNTIGQVAKRDPAVDEAVNRALTRARPYQVDYHADGSVTLRLSLDSIEVVDALSR
ncbi:MAG TPA: hypothetical protein VF624_02585 [Tepidisphaeraceae bacterium]|jgi:hypothetical protein